MVAPTPRRMSYPLARLLLATTLVLACTRPSAKSVAASTASAATPSAGGTVATASLRDSLSERADRGRILGDSAAPIWVIVASDFQCPFCKQWEDASFARVVKDYVNTGRVRLAFLNMPLNIHRNAVPAAEAAMCASAQNKFWPMHDALFATQTTWEQSENPAPKFDSLATSAGVSLPTWRQCVSKHLLLPLIEADRDRARQAGVGSTPTFFVGNQTLAGADKDIPAAIEAALKARQTPKPAS
jgi:protein-disulfide isomerase